MRLIKTAEAFFLILLVFGSDDVRRWWLTRVLKLSRGEMAARDE